MKTARTIILNGRKYVVDGANVYEPTADSLCLFRDVPRVFGELGFCGLVGGEFPPYGASPLAEAQFRMTRHLLAAAVLMAAIGDAVAPVG